jgi:7-carboxy-7-deazaguanine synthase
MEKIKMKSNNKLTVPVVELFSSLQMEGKHIGWPSVFVRIFGCNLRCRFDGVECDTPYAVHTEFDKAKSMNALEVMKEIVSKHSATNIVFTGGEPLLYQPFLEELMDMLLQRNPDYTFEVETNGTQPLKGRKIKILTNLFTISQKLGSSNQPESHERNRINNLALESFPVNKSYFKFVITNKQDIKEVRNFKQKYPNLEIYLMPEGRTQEEVLKHMKDIAELCIKHNYKYSPREHILIWSNKRGV